MRDCRGIWGSRDLACTGCPTRGENDDANRGHSELARAVGVRRMVKVGDKVLKRWYFSTKLISRQLSASIWRFSINLHTRLLYGVHFNLTFEWKSKKKEIILACRLFCPPLCRCLSTTSVPPRCRSFIWLRRGARVRGYNEAVCPCPRQCSKMQRRDDTVSHKVGDVFARLQRETS